MSIMSYPERGNWGDAKWRGNCSGYVYKNLFEQLQPKVFIDPMVGSGTSVEVAREMNIEGFGLDLHSGFNAVRDSILQATGKEADLVVSHRPYGGMIVYSGQVWGQAHPDDLSRCMDDEEFHTKMQLVLLNQREATKAGGFYGTIIGDWRRDGIYTSYQAEMIARMPRDELVAVLIKAQHNTMSSTKSYGRMRLPFILHEYILLWQKRGSGLLVLLHNLARDQYRRLTGTWKNIVKLALVQLGGQSDLAALYRLIGDQASDRLKTNPHWKDKVRQTLNSNPNLFRSCERGVWSIA